MNDAKAKYILHEIKGIKRYEDIISGIDKDLDELNRQIVDIQTPSSPQSNIGPKIENHGNKVSLINSLLSEEMVRIAEREEFAKLKVKAESYYAKLKLVCEPMEIEFANAFFKGTSYRKLSLEFGYENPYEKCLSLVKRLVN